MIQNEIKEFYKFKKAAEMTHNKKSDSTDDTLEIRVTRLEVKVDHIQSDITDIKSHLYKIDDKFIAQENKFDAKFTYLENKFDAKFIYLENKFDAKFDKLLYLIIGTLVTTVISVLVPIALHFIN